MPEVDLDNFFATEDIDFSESEDLDASEGAGPGDEEETVSEETPDSEPGELDDEAGDEDEGQDEEEEDDDEDGEPEGSDEDLDDEEPPETDERDDKISRLEAMVEKQQEELKRLLEAKEETPPPPPTAPDPQLRTALRTLLFSGPEQAKEALAGVPAHVVEQARRIALDRNERDVDYMLDPGKRYDDEIGQFVQQHVLHLIKPLLEHQTKARAASAVERFSDVLKTDEDRRGVAKTLESLPAGGTPKERLALAVELYTLRSKGKTLADKGKKLTNKERDLKAQKRARRRQSGKSKRGRRKAPEMKGNDLVEYARNLQAAGGDVEIPEGFFDHV